MLVAAGIAIYQSPQFRQWVSNSRRKVALALYNIGDEIYPLDGRSPLREDVSMTEEAGEAAEERRRVAREEILRRRSLLEARRRRRESQPLSNFDTIVDEDGKLKSDDLAKSPEALGSSTAVDISGPQLSYRGEKQNDTPVTPETQTQYEREMLETMERDRLHIALPSDVSSHHPSESLVDLTPTSEVPDAHAASVHGKPEDVSQSGYFSVASEPLSSASSHTEDASAEILYAHPDDHATNESHQDLRSPFADPQDYEQSSTLSTAGSFSHMYDSVADTSSDGTLSDFGRDSIATPTSWSEVGSVVSEDFGHH